MHAHLHFASDTHECSYFVDRVDRAVLGGLRDRERAGGCVVLTAAQRGQCANVVGRHLAVDVRETDQLRPDDVLRRSSLVHGNVGNRCTGHCIPRPRQARQREHIGARATEHRTHDHVMIEQIAHRLLQAHGVVVQAVGKCVPEVRALHCVDDKRMRTRQVVRGEVTLRRGRLNHPFSITLSTPS